MECKVLQRTIFKQADENMGLELRGEIRAWGTDLEVNSNQKTTLRMGENICKWSNWQRINLQDLQAAHAAQ